MGAPPDTNECATPVEPSGKREIYPHVKRTLFGGKRGFDLHRGRAHVVSGGAPTPHPRPASKRPDFWPSSPVPHPPQRKALACASRALGPCARGSALGARVASHLPTSHSKGSRSRNFSLGRIKGHQG